MQCDTCKSTIDDEAAWCPFCNVRVAEDLVYEDYQYEGFISYRHLPRDKAVAIRLQRRLEGMPIPHGIKVADGRKRLGKLFRDQDELPTSSSLSDQIREALKRSRFLIVVCSPQTNESVWVQREVELFVSFHGRSRVRIALAAGEPDESFPTLLRTRLRVDDEGQIVSVEEEPLAADLRNDDRKAFGSESLRIAATLIGCGYDDLVQRQRARQMRLVVAASLTVAVVSVAFGSFSLYQQRQIERNYRQMQINESEALAVESQKLLAAGDRMTAIEVALAALPKGSTSDDRPFVPAAHIALERAVQAYTPEGFWRSCYEIRGANSLITASDDGLQAVLMSNGTVRVSRIESAERLCTIDLPALLGKSGAPAYDMVPTMMCFCSNGLLCRIGYGSVVVLCDTTTGQMLWQADLAEAGGILSGDCMAASPDGTRIAIAARGKGKGAESNSVVRVVLLDPSTGETNQVYELALSDAERGGVADDVALCFSPDGGHLAAACAGSIWCMDLVQGEVATARMSGACAHELTYLDDAIVSISAEDSSAVSLYLGSAYFDAFTPGLEPLWNRREIPVASNNAQLVPLSNKAFVVGTLQSESGEELLVYVAGNAAKFVGLRGGDERLRVTTDMPIEAGCLSARSSLLSLVDYDGTLATYGVPLTEEAGATFLSSMQVAEGEFAALHLVDDIPYASIWDGASSTQRIYRLRRRTGGIAAFEPLGLPDGLSLYGFAAPNADNPTISPLLMTSDTKLCVLDPSTFESRWAIERADLGLGDSLGYALAHDRLYVYPIQPVEGACELLELSWESGEVIRRHLIPTRVDEWLRITDVDELHLDGQTLLAIVRDHTQVLLYSAETDELVGSIGPLASDIESFRQLGDLLVVTYEDGGRGHFALYRLKDGEPVDSALSSLAFMHPHGGHRDIALSWKGDRMLVNGADGLLHCLDTSSWATLWKRDCPGINVLTFSADGRFALVQDESGIFTLLSTTTGEVLRSSSMAMPLVDYFVHDPGRPQTLEAFGLRAGFAATGSSTYLSLSLDEAAFGPTSCIYLGLCCSSDHSAVLTNDSLMGDWGRQRLYTLDELIDLGKQAIRGHELTNDERHLYRIAG